MSFHSTTLEVYGAEVYLATAKPAWRALARRIKALDKAPPESAGLATFATFHPNDDGLVRPVLVIWLDRAMHKTMADVINTAAHEATHAASHLLNHIGHTIRESDEPHAYLVGWLTEWIWDNAEWTADS